MPTLRDPAAEEANELEASEKKMSAKEDLEAKANLITKALEYMNDQALMEKLRPLMKNKIKSIKDLKDLYNEKSLREARKETYLGD